MIQLRIRTEFSFGRTYAPIERTVQHLKEVGCVAAGIVDTASTWGHVKWFDSCKKAGIQPLLGVELGGGPEGLPMWFLARNEEGLRELYKAASKAHRQRVVTMNKGTVPALTYDDLRNMSENIIKFAGDMLDEDLLADIDAVIDFNPGSRVLNFQKKQLAQRLKLRTVNTSDNAYAKEGDKTIFELISDGGTKPSPQHILPLKNDGSEAAIAASCKDLEMPHAPMIQAEGDLEALCREGIKFRKMEAIFANDARYQARLKHELTSIREKNYDAYFIVVADMVRYAKQHMLVGPSRGSAAGSLVCYLTRITEIDPVPPGLFFERFIDLNRSDLPDIDLDFPDKKREMVFKYMAEKYGHGNTAHIGTVATFKPKSALIQVCKKLSIPPAATGAVKAAMIERSSADRRANNCLLDTLKDTDPGKQLVKMYPQVLMAAEIEAHASHTGTHAAGLLVCNERIDNFATIDDNGIAQVDMASIKALGLLKIDVLGLRTLSVLEDAGLNIDWYNMKFDDPDTYQIFSDGKLSAIFQFEGAALRSISKRITFSKLSDIDAVTALARPGPFGGGVTHEYIERRNGKPYKPIHPAVEEHMKETYGLPVYQEQTMAIVRNIGGFSWKATAAVRTAISKRLGKELFDNFWIGYKEGATKLGMTEQEAKASWDLINAMGAWQMNKSIAAGTLVRLTANNTGLPIWCPIEKLYEKYVENPSKWMRTFKSMPRLLSLYPDGRGRPQRAKMIHRNGKRHCIELHFDDGTKVRCSLDHRFIIDGKWQACKNAKTGSRFISLERDAYHDSTVTGQPIGSHNGRRSAMKKFRKEMKGKPCQRCGEEKLRREIHHLDHAKGTKRPNDLAWLCSSCHKMAHRKYGDRGVPFHRGHQITHKTLMLVKSIGELETYDIEMEKHHNYVINGGIVTHNSHTYSYAVISYWCAFAKAHHPLEFALANMKNERDEETSLTLLRELHKEGLRFIPFDPQLSEADWCIKDGKLIGGFNTLHGFGESKAQEYVKARATGKLTKEMIDKALAAPNNFADLFPLHTKFGELYTDPDKHGIIGPVLKIEQLDATQEGSYVFLGKLIKKNPRDANEDVNVKKRNGKILRGPVLFLDMHIKDDTGIIMARIDRFKYEAMGRVITEKIDVGATFLIRAYFKKGIRFAFINKWKLLEGEMPT